jgi:hypothetical protein
MVSACDWVVQDLKKLDILDEFGQTTSSCGDQFLAPCRFVANACRRANTTINWVKDGFKDSVFTSTEILEEDKVRERLEAHLKANLQVARLISTSPQETVEAWAAQNMPKIVDMTGDIAKRVKLLTALQNQAHTRISELQLLAAKEGDLFTALVAAGVATNPATFATAVTTAATALATQAAAVTPVTTGPVVEWGALKTRCQTSTTPGWTITKPSGKTFVSTGQCDPETDFPQYADTDNDADYSCFTEACLWGGTAVDREARRLDEIYASPWVNNTRVSAFDMYDARYPGAGGVGPHQHSLPTIVDRATGLPGGKPMGGWLDAENDHLVVNETRRDCTATESWLKSDVLKDPLSVKDVLTLIKTIYDDLTAPLPSKHFRPANRGGCDMYALSIDTNYFEVDSAKDAEEFFDYFIAELGRFAALVKSGDTSILNAGVSADNFLAKTLASLNKLIIGKEFVLQGLAGLHYSPDGDHTKAPNIRHAIENNFVNTSRVELRYLEYFEKCKIKSCTHLVDARMSSSALMSILLGIIGGFWSVVEVGTRTVYNFGRWLILRSDRHEDYDDEESDELDHLESKTPQDSVASYDH